MRDITPALVFNNQAEEAARFYVPVFSSVSGKSKILYIRRYTDEELKALSYVPEEIRPGPAGSIMTVQFLLNGQEFTATNGGPYFSFSQGMSLYVRCESQAEIDGLWERLSEGGEKQQCGWLKDKFGVSWQIAPDILNNMMTDPDPARVSRVMVAIYGMKKYDIAALRKAYSGS
jgi:predicted 3-demethylubiquinone-9 3-methyltransferase (glyoxalase superfamily)